MIFKIIVSVIGMNYSISGIPMCEQNQFDRPEVIIEVYVLTTAKPRKIIVFINHNILFASSYCFPTLNEEILGFQ